MTPEEEQEWQERLTAAVKETLRKRAERAELRRQLTRRRAYGLAQRQAEKLARTNGSGMEYET